MKTVATVLVLFLLSCSVSFAAPAKPVLILTETINGETKTTVIGSTGDEGLDSAVAEFVNSVSSTMDEYTTGLGSDMSEADLLYADMTKDPESLSVNDFRDILKGYVEVLKEKMWPRLKKAMNAMLNSFVELQVAFFKYWKEDPSQHPVLP